jgi:hypothetical protein
VKYVSTAGLVLSGAFLLISIYLILTQGLFGESFIALILGMPWILLLSYFEFFEPSSSVVLAILILIPIILNAGLLYGAGLLLEKVLPDHWWLRKAP